MKKCIFILLAALSLFSCKKIEPQYSRSYGSEVVFGPSTKRGASTKASYSGVTDKDKYERIDWVAGDAIRIYCPQASAPAAHYSDYFVTAGKVTSSGKSSSASISHAPEASGLKWGSSSSKHRFTALYPAPGYGVSGASVSENSVTCVLPAEQTFSGSVTYGKGHHVAAPNYSYLYLAGYGEATPGEKGSAVEMYFDPAVTTFQFTLKNAYASGNNMTVKSAGITSSAGSLTGKYSIDVTGINGTTGTLTTSDIDTSKVSGKTITMNFPTAVSVAKNDSLTFTLFAQPGKNPTKLTFWFIDNDGFKRSFSFKYSDPTKGTDGWVDFTAFHKIKIRGLMAPESVGWIINSVPLIADWGENEIDLDVDSGSVLILMTPAVVTWGTGNSGNISYTD